MKCIHRLLKGREQELIQQKIQRAMAKEGADYLLLAVIIYFMPRDFAVILHTSMVIWSGIRLRLCRGRAGLL